MGIIINENVAENFINGPIGAKGSKGIRITDPIPQHNTPAKGPNIKKHVTQMIDTGSKQANPSGVRGKYGTTKSDNIKERALNNAAPEICRTNWDDFDI